MFTIQNFLDKIKKEKLDTSLPLAVIGHYGEVHHLDGCDFHVTECYDVITLNKRNPWTGAKKENSIKSFKY